MTADEQDRILRSFLEERHSGGVRIALRLGTTERDEILAQRAGEWAVAGGKAEVHQGCHHLDLAVITWSFV